MLRRRHFHALMLGAGAAATLGRAARAADAAQTAAEAAKQFSGTTLTVTYEAGLQPMDPKIFSGPMWEKLTGIKIEIVEMAPNEMFTKTIAAHPGRLRRDHPGQGAIPGGHCVRRAGNGLCAR